MKKDSNVRNKISQAIKIYIKESYSTQTKIGQNALIQRKISEQEKEVMGDTIEDMDKEVEKKGNKIEFLETKIGLTDSKFIEELNKLGLRKYHPKGDRIMDRIKFFPNNHKYKKDKKQ